MRVAGGRMRAVLNLPVGFAGASGSYPEHAGNPLALVRNTKRLRDGALLVRMYTKFIESTDEDGDARGDGEICGAR